MGSLRKVCFKGKAQALIEVAIFGAILLTVLSFLIRYGMVYNQRQSLDMRAFRKALSESVSAERPDAQATVYLVEDKHIPDAGDMFGVGDVHTAEARASVVWGNTLKTDGYEDENDLPRIQYIINGDERAYTIAGYVGHDPNVPTCLGATSILLGGSFFVKVPNHNPISVTMSDLRIYYNDRNELEGAMVMTESGEKDFITGIWHLDGKTLLQITGIVPDSDDPECVECFYLLNPSRGRINPDYLVSNLGNDIDGDGIVDVTDASVQGLFTSKQVVKRGDSLKLEDSSADIKSITVNDTEITVTHTISYGAPWEDGVSYTYSDEEEESWPSVQK